MITNLEIMSAEDQHKLNNLKVALLGNNYTSEIAAANLIGLGVKTIGIYGKPNKRFFSDSFLTTRAKHLDLWSEEELTKEKIETENFEYIIDTRNTSEKFDTNINYFKLKNTEPIKKCLEATLIVDEIRKQHVKLQKYDTPSSCFQTIADRVNKLGNQTRHNKTTKKILAIGAGGIGNYFALGTAINNTPITMMDYDIFEEKNANRQIFCEPGIKKVKAISKILKNVKAIDSKLDLNYLAHLKNKEQPDIIIGCLDNFKTRNLLSQYTKENNILYLDGGVGTTKGQVLQNPDKFQLPKLKPNKEKSCAHVPNPSIVIPNCIIGLYLAHAINYDLNNKEIELNYNTLLPTRLIEQIGDKKWYGHKKN